MNWTNLMQEKLQQLAPTYGCNCDLLWTFEDRSMTDTKRARVIIKILKENLNPYMEWSEPCQNLKLARQCASEIAYLKVCEFEQNGSFDLSHAPRLIISQNHHNNNGTGMVEHGKYKILPDYFDGDIMKIIATELQINLNRSTDTSTMPSNMSILNNIEFEEESSVEIAEQILPDIPLNLGVMGEVFATRWIRQQVWVNACTVCHINEFKESKLNHDISFEMKSKPGRKYFIEVKTKWGKFGGAKASADQLEQLENRDDYFVMIIGHFRNLFEVSPSAPVIRLLGRKKFSDFIDPPPVAAAPLTKKTREARVEKVRQDKLRAYVADPVGKHWLASKDDHIVASLVAEHASNLNILCVALTTKYAVVVDIEFHVRGYGAFPEKINSLFCSVLRRPDIMKPEFVSFGEGGEYFVRWCDTTRKSTVGNVSDRILKKLLRRVENPAMKVFFGSKESWVIVWEDETYWARHIPNKMRDMLYRNRNVKTISSVSFGPDESYFVTFVDGSIECDLSLFDTARESMRTIDNDLDGYVRHVYMSHCEESGDESCLIRYAARV